MPNWRPELLTAHAAGKYNFSLQLSRTRGITSSSANLHWDIFRASQNNYETNTLR